MTPSTLPNKLWRALSEVKNYVEKFPSGVSRNELHQKVKAYHDLNKKDKDSLVAHIQERSVLLVFKAKKHGSVIPTTFFRHKKYGHLGKIDGYEYPLKKPKERVCCKCKQEKPLSEFSIANDRASGVKSYCKKCDNQKRAENALKLKLSKPLEKISKIDERCKVMTNPSSPEQLRKQAEELLKAAEQAEKNQATEKWKTEFKKEFEQQKLEVMQAVGMANRKFDEMMDAMATLSKVSEKFKLLKVE
ncbi:hypothetical protein AB7263_18925 [Providencia rettgeri]